MKPEVYWNTEVNSSNKKLVSTSLVHNNNADTDSTSKLAKITSLVGIFTYTAICMLVMLQLMLAVSLIVWHTQLKAEQADFQIHINKLVSRKISDLEQMEAEVRVLCLRNSINSTSEAKQNQVWSIDDETEDKNARLKRQIAVRLRTSTTQPAISEHGAVSTFSNNRDSRVTPNPSKLNQTDSILLLIDKLFSNKSIENNDLFKEINAKISVH